ncbi:glycosyltransferase [Aliiglaciecola sp.]|nr:glycosyltransferase [Aliiglaciecola sp.]
MSKAVSFLESKNIEAKNYLEQAIHFVYQNELPISDIFSSISRFYTQQEKELVRQTGLFDKNFYLTSYPDVASAGIDPFTHYLEFGWREDRDPHLEFNTAFNKAKYIHKSENTCPLLTFANGPKAENNSTISPRSFVLNQEKVSFPKDKKLAIHIHLYYPEILKELLPLISEIYNSIDIFITTVSKYKESRVNAVLSKQKVVNKVEVVQVENTGRDIAPMVVALGKKLGTYDYVCHLHSKKSPHTHFGDRWRAYLFDQLIGSEKQLDSIISAFEKDPKLGLIYPNNYFEIKKFTDWNGNFDAIEAFLEKIGFDESGLNESQSPAFPAGSMCWFRPKALHQLFNGKMTLEDFEFEDSQEEGTLAHVIERCLGILPILNGFKADSFHSPIVEPQRYAKVWKGASAQTSYQPRDTSTTSRWLRDTPAIALNERVALSAQFPYYNEQSLTIHWVIPDFGLGAGGHMTIFRMVRFLEEFGHRQTIWIQNAQNYVTPAIAKQVINNNYQEIGEGVIVQFLPEDVAWISGDVVIATDCWTVFPVHAMSKFKERFYLIQDWEPMFHPVGDSHLIAQLTYSMGFNALCAGEWLYSKAREAGMWARSWKLATDKKIYFPAEEPVDNGDLLHVAFYARAYTPRRAVMMGVAALQELDRRGVNLHVSFFGENGVNFNVSFSHEYLGIMSPDELGELYRKSDVGMVFSATNYSLIPLEMMGCALPVLELDVESTRAVFDESFIELVKPDPLAIADRLESLAKNPESIREKSAKALDYALSLDWEESARSLEQGIFDKLKHGSFKSFNKTELFEHQAKYKVTASVIIPTYNAGNEFEAVLDILLRQACSFEYEIVIVDSGSSDQTVDLIRSKKSDRIKLYEIPNTEFQHGRTRNYAISMSEGEFVAVITQDAMPADEHWLTHLINGFEQAPDAVGVFGSHKAYESHSDFVKRDIFRVFERFNMFGEEYSWYFDQREPGSKDWQFALQYYSDNNSCMRKSVWDQLPYPEIDWGEDQAWAWMIVQLGLTKVYQKDAVVYHSHDDTPEIRYKTAKTEAQFFNDRFGIKLCNPDDNVDTVVQQNIDSERAYGEHENLDKQLIEKQLTLVEAGLKGRFAALKNEK